MLVNLRTLVGAVLIVVGIIAFAYRGIPYTSRETMVDAASLHASGRRIIPMSPLIIGLVLVSGAALLTVGAAKSS